MSVTYVKSKKLFDVLPQYRVDESQITNRTSGVEYISFHNRSTYSNIRLKIPAGTEVTGVILRKSSDPHQSMRLPRPLPDLYTTPTPPISAMSGEWDDSNFPRYMMDMEGKNND